MRGRGAHTEAVSRLSTKYGIAERTGFDWIAAAHEEYNIDYTLFRPFQYQGLKHGNKAYPAYRPTEVLTLGEPTRIAIIGDCHDAPTLPEKDRFKWMGRWIHDNDFEEVWQVGDFATLDSLTRHAAPGTKTFADLPSFRDDLESLDEALMNFTAGLQGKVIQKAVTLGNHEARAERYEDSNPQMAGSVAVQLHDVFRSHGWRIIPYGEMAFTNGVAIVHNVTNGAGRPYGGKTANQRVGNDAVHSIIHGHDHKRESFSSSKVGPSGGIEIISAGCSLPWGQVEEYASHGPSGWWWGVCSFSVSQGAILDQEYMSMLTLERKYRD